MEKMKELYEKVAKDSALQAKFSEIMKDAEKSGAEATGKKLIVFAKEAGFEVTPEEFRDFFSKLDTLKEGSLSDEELDAVAGGKMEHCTSMIKTPSCDTHVEFHTVDLE